MKKQDLPSIHNYQLDIDLQKLRASCDTLAEKFVDVRTANPMLCDNHMELVASVYDNFEQIIREKTIKDNELGNFYIEKRIKSPKLA